MTLRISLLFAVTSLAACAIDRRSPDFACETQADCPSDRVCAEGWCVEGGGDPPDAAVLDDGAPAPDGPPAPDAPPPDAFVCPPACNSCTGGVCTIACSADGSCATPVVCPAGLPCKVECIGADSCAGGIDCTGGTSCRIECTGMGSCGGAITCGARVCRVECGAPSSCTGGIDCSSACQCDTFCTGAGSCSMQPICPPPQQCDKGVDCTGVPGQCNTC
jgi:hypothetical protein